MNNIAKESFEKQLNGCTKEELFMICMTLKIQLDEANLRMDNMMEQIRLAQHNLYGRSSEKNMLSEGYEQISMFFNEAEGSMNAELKEPEYEEVVPKAYKRKKTKGKRDSDLSQFPIVVIEHKIPENEAKCINCEGILKKFTTEKYKLLKFVPAHFVVEEHVVEVYSCEDCESVVRADRPQNLLRGSIATPSLVSAIINAKYVNAVPLYRQEQEFLRYGVNISRQTMANWIIRCAEEYLFLIYQQLKISMLSMSYLQADETRVTVLKEENRKASTESWMWVYRTSELCKERNIILFEYQQTRAGYHPKEFLGNYTGNLTSDGYWAYHGLPSDIVISGCWAHMRRKISDCLKGFDSTSQKRTLAYEAIKRIGLLYKIESILAESTPEKRLEERQLQSKPIVESFFKWVDTVSVGVPGNSLLNKAFTYAKNQKQYLYTYLSDGNIPIDNSATERAIKPFAIGRNNWLFCDTPAGAEASAVLYSIVETAKANFLKPYDYIAYLLEEIPKYYFGTDKTFLENLMPWSDKIPESCKSLKSIKS